MLFELIVEMIRTLLVEAVSERVRAVWLRRGLRGMRDVHRHLHFATRKRLLQRLSTELKH